MSAPLTSWRLWDDQRTNAELRARWNELAKEGNASRDPEEALRIMNDQDEIFFTLDMRRLIHIGDDWLHPHRRPAAATPLPEGTETNG